MPRLDIPPFRSSMFQAAKGSRVWDWTLNGYWFRWFGNVYEAVKAGNFKEVHFGIQANGDLVDQSWFIANRAYQVVAIQENHAALGTDGSAVSLQVTKDVDGEAPGAGKNLLTNNSDAGFNLKATIDTTQEGTLSTTESDLQLTKGDRLSVDFAGVLTSVAGLSITVSLRPLSAS